mmetsp:Transcript_116362/g.324229  ORF Transcript_116362/g.324229 Transcript_116362/m.324229 type:complete len:285 (+) Transcript_116362:486-1340(+)
MREDFRLTKLGHIITGELACFEVPIADPSNHARVQGREVSLFTLLIVRSQRPDLYGANLAFVGHQHAQLKAPEAQGVGGRAHHLVPPFGAVDAAHCPVHFLHLQWHVHGWLELPCHGADPLLNGVLLASNGVALSCTIKHAPHRHVCCQVVYTQVFRLELQDGCAPEQVHEQGTQAPALVRVEHRDCRLNGCLGTPEKARRGYKLVSRPAHRDQPEAVPIVDVREAPDLLVRDPALRAEEALVPVIFAHGLKEETLSQAIVRSHEPDGEDVGWVRTVCGIESPA